MKNKSGIDVPLGAEDLTALSSMVTECKLLAIKLAVFHKRNPADYPLSKDASNDSQTLKRISSVLQILACTYTKGNK